MEPTSVSTWLGVLAILITTIGGIVTVMLGRSRTREVEIDKGLPQPPNHNGDTWMVSPEMYQWFQEQMSTLYERVGNLEDQERKQRHRADKFERLLKKALLHIAQQDQRMAEANMASVPMDPELTARMQEGD